MSVTDSTANQREKAVAFIVARLSSSRLPAKQLKRIGDKPLLQWIIERLTDCRELDQIVIATVAEEANLALKHYADEQGIPCFWYQGEVDHVTTRLRRAAEEYRADICLLISGDCPLVDTTAIDLLVRTMRSHPGAEVLAVGKREAKACMLEGVHVARLAAWQRADDLSTRPEQKEHQFPVIGQQPQLFSWHKVLLPEKFYAEKHRLSVDTRADLEFMNTLHERLTAGRRDFTLDEVLKQLDAEPALRDINSHVHQRRLIERGNKVLFVTDAGGGYGLGHLMRSIELATQLTERKGWTATFLVDDAAAQSTLEAHGFTTHWGAFARAPRTSKAAEPADFQILCRKHSLLIIDIFDQRGAAEDWRKNLPETLTVVSLGNAQPWAEAADMLIMPGYCRIPENLATLGKKGEIIILQGPENLILRREITRSRPADKDLDLLVYLHNDRARSAVANFAAAAGLKCVVLKAFSATIPELMSRAKIYLSGFGISSYEALALKALPVCWPHSQVNKRDALNFYARLNITPRLIRQPEQLAECILPLPSGTDDNLPAVQDGSPHIVEKIAQLLDSRRR